MRLGRPLRDRPDAQRKPAACSGNDGRLSMTIAGRTAGHVTNCNCV